jgi:acyl carrier protein
MIFSSLSFTPPVTEGIEVGKIRAIVAKHLHVDIKRVTDEAHFREDLGADWLDRLELLILVEDEFSDVEISDGNADHIQTVGDLIRLARPRDGSPTS